MTLRPQRGDWLSRTVGVVIFAEQIGGHATGHDPSLHLIAAGLFFLAGKEGLMFLALLLGRRVSEHSLGAPPPDSPSPPSSSSSERDL